MINKKIKEIIEDVLDNMGIKEPSFSVEIPKSKENGNYSANIALVLSRKLKKNPLEIAQDIAEKLKSKDFYKIGIEKIETANPGFINFYLSDRFFIDNIRSILKNKNFGKNHSLKNQKVITPLEMQLKY